MTEADLPVVLVWRNHPDVRRSMFTRHEIAADEHRRWYERCTADPLRHLLVFEVEGRPQGFVNFTVGLHPKVADWGFYTAPGAPKGTGRAMGSHAFVYAFEALGLHKICGQALVTNEASIGLHRALGFQQEGVLREQHFEDGQYRDVICFGLLFQEWGSTP
ncbi:UDP-4-amino-4,6-dideoxy-N-acetyl-beta-L-altrosamine N-acetyltransferase [Sphaerotilaceae bacterium SBD11-9]